MKIAVDLTPVLPGGQNGGVKPLVLGLLRDLIALAPNVDFVLLTSSTTDAELSTLDAHNVRRLRVVQVGQAGKKASSAVTTSIPARRRLRLALTRVLPPPVMLRIELAYLAATGRRPKPATLPSALGARLFFSPFMTQSFQEPGLPSISLVHDVQFLQYPRFFPGDQRSSLHRQLQNAARCSDRLICTSAFVQRTMLEHVQVAPARVAMIPPLTFRRLPSVTREDCEDVLAGLGLASDGFLLYPSSFSPHKNHGMLLTAFGMYLARHPKSDFKLVCPGEQGAGFEELRHTTRVMGLSDRVLYPGFVNEMDLAALYQTCRAVIFPSLYEGLGLAVVEAVAFHKPVLCSAHASLRDAAGNSARYFDPRLLRDVAEAVELAAEDPALLQPGSPTAAEAKAAPVDPTGAAEAYLRLFYEVAA